MPARPRFGRSLLGLIGLTCAVAMWAPAAQAHGGGLNAEGCHNNRKTGDYHCHRAPAPAATPRQFVPTPPQPSVPGVRPGRGPTCYVGPRGGTYTITPSGRKNYAGC